MEYKTDVLIVGSGLAGYCAALSAREFGVDVMVASIGRGASPNVSGFRSWQDDSANSLAQMIEEICEAGGGLNCRELVENALRKGKGIYEKFSGLGVDFLRDKTGHMVPKTASMGGKDRIIGYRTACEFGLTAEAALKKAAPAAGIEQLAETEILLPILQNGRLIGAAGIQGAEWVIIRAKAVVLACGGIGSLFPSSTYPQDVAAGYVAFALLAGASLKDMEFLQYEPAVLCGLPSVGRMPLPTSLWEKGAVLLNGKGERFLQKYWHTSEKELRNDGKLDKDRIARMITAEVAVGRGTQNGGVWYDARNVDAEELRRFSIKNRRLNKAGFDLSKDPVEVFPAPHSHMGGVDVDPDCASCVPGLFAAGESAAGFLGASRMPGYGGASAVLLGTLAGEQAAIFARNVKETEDPLWWEAVYRAQRQAQRLCSQIVPGAAQRVPGIMTRYYGLEKNAWDLQNGLEMMKDLRASGSPVLCERSVSARLRDFGAVCAAECMIRAALLRTESRGCFYRSDYPERRDDVWSRSLRAQLDEHGNVIVE